MPGDIDQNSDPPVQRRAGVLAQSFRDLIAYIREVAKGALEGISRGDLEVDARPRSANDVLCNSLQTAIAYVKEVSQALAISAASWMWTQSRDRTATR